MLNRTSPRRLISIVLALLLGILLGLAFIPSPTISGAQPSGICDSVSEIPTAECEALEALFTSTSGPTWKDNSDWLETNTPCDWYGVTCSAGKVWQLDLTANQLDGPLPPAIGNLSSLQVLLLSNNMLRGTLPDELSQLSLVTRLNLAHNQLSGSIPSSLGAMTQLRALSLAYNDLAGEIPDGVGQLANLQTLELVSNTLSGPIPTELGNLSQLEWLDLGHNALTGTIPAELGQPSALSTLYLESNQLQGEVPSQLCSNVILASLGYNMLDPLQTDSCVKSLIVDSWEETQTLPPNDFVAWSSSPGEVELRWTINDQLVDIGYYEVLFTETSGGPYTLHGQTEDKLTSKYVIRDLDPNTRLFFVVRAVTPANENNQNELVSVNSPEAPVTPTAVTLVEFSGSQHTSNLLLLLAAGLLLLTAGTIIYLRMRPKKF